jgi:hypothetical protein
MLDVREHLAASQCRRRHGGNNTFCKEHGTGKRDVDLNFLLCA